MSGILSGIKVIGTPGSGGGNATVPEDAFMGPPQVYVDNVEKAAGRLSIMTYTTADLYLPNLGMTYFTTKSNAWTTGNPIAPSSTIDLTGNALSSENMIELFAEFRAGVEYFGDNATYFYTDGPDMGCPLTGGTAGGWTLEFDPGYVPGTAFDFDSYSSYANPHQVAITASDGINFADSYAADNFPGWYVTIGVMDHPTTSQILAKIEELLAPLLTAGTLSLAGGVLTYTHDFEGAWSVSTSTGDLITDASGIDPGNADIEYLAFTANCYGSFTGPDGVTQVNFGPP